MGGRDKGLVRWQGRPLVAHVLEHFAPQVDAVFVSANRNLDAYAAFGVPVVSDTVPGFAGPLAGMLSALRAAGTAEIACVPCDSPWLPADLVRRLRSARAASGARAAYVVTPAGPLYTHLLLTRQCAPELEAALASEERSARALLARLDAAVVNFEDWPEPLNLNSP